VTEEQREKRRAHMREYMRMRRATESEEERAERLRFDRMRARIRLEAETEEQRERRLARCRAYYHAKKKERQR
jgi:hypothetical protein